MSEHPPRIRVQNEDGYVFVREGLSLCFYMHRSHRGLGPAILRALDIFQRALAPGTLAQYVDMEGDWPKLDTPSWERLQKELLESEHPFVTMASESNGVSEYQFEYFSSFLEGSRPVDEPGQSCFARFQLPTEYMEKHGPGHVRELALKLASQLPFNSGYASLSFHALMDLVGVTRKVRSMCFRYPGMDLMDDSIHRSIGTRAPGAYWMTFLGQPVLGELGGVDGLRARLSSPATTVQPLEADRAVVTLGPWPRAGDLEAGDTLPEYRELARLLEPWLYHRSPDAAFNPDFRQDDWLRWERRFLD
ncbi:type VI immunity family protein [Pyxidicoccus xibeiensis]|uniref:type VI immunity family protein n=1 Tax=Pyxidicoccus xibeiensis TaxID=2906759 RepID=UPI0020A73B3C|nr:type VI immunity family protein [Pyxidicoccus xibeiensis]MCP3144699.1 DUF3396 domain-containing protein [Pyxidicoccus xibeiensis]